MIFMLQTALAYPDSPSLFMGYQKERILFSLADLAFCAHIRPSSFLGLISSFCPASPGYADILKELSFSQSYPAISIYKISYHNDVERLISNIIDMLIRALLSV